MQTLALKLHIFGSKTPKPTHDSKNGAIDSTFGCTVVQVVGIAYVWIQWIPRFKVSVSVIEWASCTGEGVDIRG